MKPSKISLIYEKCQPLNPSLFVDNDVENEETKALKDCYNGKH